MLAVVIERFGDLSGLAVKEVPDPSDIDHDSALVQIRAAGVNPSDVKNVQGAFPDTTLPRIPGRDFAGVVVAGRQNLIGQQVSGSGGDIGYTRDGAHAGLIKLPANGFWTKPSNLSFEQAAGVGTPFVAAWQGLIDRARMTAHDTVLVVGASGAVGSAAVQIANWKGAAVLGAMIEEDQLERVRNLGARESILLSEGTDLREAVLAVNGGKGANVVFDTVGGILFEKSLSALAPGGRLIEITATGQRRVSFDLLDFYHNELRLYGVDTRKVNVTGAARILEGLCPGFESGALKPPDIAEVFPLARAREAYQSVAGGKVLGKVILVP